MEGIGNRMEGIDNRTGDRTDRIDDRTDRVDDRTNDTLRDDRGDRVDDRGDDRMENIDNRADNSTDRVGERGDVRTDRLENRVDNRPDRFENREERYEQRQTRRDEVREQFHDNHPRYDFWKDHPNWARWRWNRPYRWATWGLLTGWSSGAWSQPAYYSYGDNVYYEGDTVYYGTEAVATSEEYAQQAQAIATSAPEPADDTEWLPLGVFALTQDGESSGPAPTIFLQLAVDKQGVIAGTVTNRETEEVQAIEGAVDKKTQRSAWVVEGKSSPIMETGLANLTKDEAPALLHFADGQTQQWLLVRLEEPEGEAASD